MNALIIAVAALLSRAPAPDSLVSLPSLASLPVAQVTVNERADEIVIEMAPIDLPAGLSHEAMHGGGHAHGASSDPMAAIEPGYPPVSLVTMPLSGAIYGFRVEIVDSAGRQLPSQLLHHLNFIDPAHRELFLPISRRLIAAGKETGSQRLPWLLFGLPVRQGQQLVINAMLHNPTSTAYRQVRTRLVLSYTRASRPWPFVDVFPWQLDVLFPVGDKSFDLPPGHSVKSYDARPAVSGKIVAVGGHVHEHATSISLTDVTTGEVLWTAKPTVDSLGTVRGVPVGRLYKWNSVGTRIVPEHVYRVTVEYHNPTNQVLPEGGMGVIGGLFAPDEPDAWPAAVPSDTLYATDMRHYLRLWRGRSPAGRTAASAAAAAPAHRH
jgi:hypothetical protein